MNCLALEVDWPAAAAVFGAVTQGLGAIAVAIVGGLGLSTWKQQLRGTRSQALAEDALSLVYRVVDAIGHMRQPFALAGEMKSVHRGEEESEEDFDLRKEYGVVEIRYQQHAEVASQLAALRFRVRAALGKEAQDAIEEILKVLRGVRNEAAAAGRLKKIMLHRADLLDRYPSDDQIKAYEGSRDRLAQAEDRVWATDPEFDNVVHELSEAVTRAEAALRSFATVGRSDA